MHISITESRYLQRLIDNCALRRDEKSCMILDRYLVTTRFESAIAEILSGPKIKFPPIGPDPAPDINEGDPDGNPVIVVSEGLTRGSARANARLEMAVELRRGLREIGEVLDRDIEALGAFAGALSKA